MRTPLVRRAAALLALAALAGALWLVVEAFTPDAARLLIAVPAAAVAVAALWTALTTRGTTRVGAVLVALAALGVIVVTGLRADAILPSTGALVLALLSGVLADVALPDLPDSAGRPAPPPRRPVLFMNPRSGGGKVGSFDLVSRAEALGARVVLIEAGLDLHAAAEEAVAAGADLLGVAGGDGSQAVVAGVASRHDLPFLVIPAGTRNHFALDLRLDRADPAAALTALRDGLERRVDLGLVGDRVFVNNVSFGAYARIVAEEGYRESKIATALRRLPDLMGAGAPASGLVCRIPGREDIADGQVVLISNNAYRFGGRASGTRPHLDAGELGILSVRVGGGHHAARLAVEPLRGGDGWRETTAPAVEVSGPDGELAAGVDGESVTFPAPVTLRVAPAALRVRLPRTGLVAAPSGGRTALGAVPRLLRAAFGPRG